MKFKYSKMLRLNTKVVVKCCFMLRKCKENGEYRKNLMESKRTFKQTKTVFMHLITTDFSRKLCSRKFRDQVFL